MAIIAQARKIGGLATQLGSVNAMLYLVNQALVRLSGGRAGLYKYYFVAQPIITGKPLPASTSAAIQLTADRKSTRLNSSHLRLSRMPSSA